MQNPFKKSQQKDMHYRWLCLMLNTVELEPITIPKDPVVNQLIEPNAKSL